MLRRRSRGFWRFVWPVLAVEAALFAPAWTADSSIEFLSPRNLATALGPTEVELKVVLAPGATVQRVELKVDDELLTTMTAAPWTTTWDAGDATRGHRLEAVAYLSDGTTARAVIRTSALRINQVLQVGLVNLYVLVRAPDGSYVTDLGKEDFQLTEDGRPEAIDRFSTEGKLLRIGIVLDTSHSMVRDRNKLESAKKAALEFLDALKPGDQGTVVTFNDEVRIAQPLTEDTALMADAIRGAAAAGGTALYDAIYRTATQLRELEGRRVMVLLSDGRDEAYNGLEPGSLHTIDEALNRALRSEVMVFAIGFGNDLGELDFYERETHKEILTRVAQTTGGRVLFPKRASQLRKAFQAVADDLRHQYSLAYASDNAVRDGSWREIRLTVARPDLTVITRKGYFAPQDPDTPEAVLESR